MVPNLPLVHYNLQHGPSLLAHEDDFTGPQLTKEKKPGIYFDNLNKAEKLVL